MQLVHLKIFSVILGQVKRTICPKNSTLFSFLASLSTGQWKDKVKHIKKYIDI